MVQAQARPAFLEVDLTSAQGVALRRSVSEKYGPTIVEAASLAERMFLSALAMGAGTAFYRRGDQACLCRRRMHRGFIQSERIGRNARRTLLCRALERGSTGWRRSNARLTLPAIANLAEVAHRTLARSHRRNRAGHGPTGTGRTTPLAMGQRQAARHRPHRPQRRYMTCCSRPIGACAAPPAAAPEATHGAQRWRGGRSYVRLGRLTRAAGTDRT
jgi:hypothetical protein